MSKPRKKPHEQTMWVIKDATDPKGVCFWSGYIEDTQRECIAQFLFYAPDPWAKYYKAGYRCVKVKVTEIAK